jgi:hypothetical protein
VVLKELYEGQAKALPTGLTRFRRSKLRASMRRLVDAARQQELNENKPIQFEYVRAFFAADLAEAGVLATDAACLALYLHKFYGFDDAQCAASTFSKANAPTQTEFAAYEKINLYKKMEDALLNPRQAPQVLQSLLTHDRVNKNGERRLVQESFAYLLIGILKAFIDGLDFATLTLSYQYLDMKHEGIRRSLKSWNSIAESLGELYFCEKRKKKMPSSRFWEAVIWLKKKNVIQSKAISIKDRVGEYSAIPSFKSIDRDFLIALGLKEEKLESLRSLSAQSTTERIKARIEKLTNEHFNPLERLQAVARHFQRLKEQGAKIKRTLHGVLKICIINEFKLDELYPLRPQPS